MGERDSNAFLRALALGAVLIAIPPTRASDARDNPAAPAPTSAQRTPENQRFLGVAKPIAPGTAPDAATNSQGIGSGIVRTTLSLGAVLALLIACAVVVRRLASRNGSLISAAGPGGRAPSGIIEVLGRYPLSRSNTLLLLRVDRRVLLLAQAGGGSLRAPGSLATLTEIADADEVASILAKAREADGQSLTHRFATALTGAERAMRGPAEPAPLPDSGDVTTARRRHVISSAGDRAELWDIPAGLGSSAQPDPADQPPPAAIDAAADTLRRRLMALGSRPPLQEGEAA